MNNLVKCEWKYYNHALFPNCKPHQSPVPPDRKILGRGTLLARWTSDWDCESETGWYWCIKDTPLDLNCLNSKKRYEIKKGMANFDVKIINPKEYENDLFLITYDALSNYPKVYKNVPNKSDFQSKISTWNTTFGAFDKNTKKLCGYILMGRQRDEVLYYSSQCVLQSEEKRYINSALVYGMLDYYKEQLGSGYYIVDGEKNINHITNHQDYLCNKMGFRKVNVKLNVIYTPLLKLLINFCYPFRKIIYKCDLKSRLTHNICGLLKMESAVRNQRKL